MKLLLPILLLLQLSVSAQSFGSFRSYVLGLSDATAQTAAVDSFMSATTFPYSDGDTAYFVYHGSATVVQLAGDFNFWDPTTLNLTQLAGTDLYWADLNFEAHARMDYKFVVDGSWILDPLHTNTIMGGFGPNSEWAMPGYVQPWEITAYPTVAQGTIEAASITSDFGSTYSLQIYLPPGYDPTRGAGYPVAYFQDGHEYVSFAQAGNIFDNLIDSGLIEPTIGVFVRPNNRNEEYAFSLRNSYRLFFVDQLVPWVDANYNSENHPGLRAVIGASFGGNISGQIAFLHPDVFGNCGLHSGAFWPNSGETFNLFAIEQPAVRIASIWGSYEGLLTTEMTDFKDDVIAAGNELTWDIWPEGHSWGLWRASLDEMLKFFFPPGVTGLPLEVEQVSNFSVSPNPSPQSGTLLLKGSISESVQAAPMLYALDGKLVSSAQSVMLSGNFTFNFEIPALTGGTYQLVLTDENGWVIGRSKVVLE